MEPKAHSSAASGVGPRRLSGIGVRVQNVPLLSMEYVIPPHSDVVERLQSKDVGEERQEL